MDECKGEPPAAAAAAAASRPDDDEMNDVDHDDAAASSSAAAVFMSRMLPARVELPECDICNEPLECSEAAAADPKASRLPRQLPCGHTYCTRCIQSSLDVNGGLLKCPERCTIDPPQRPGSAPKLPKNFGMIAMLEAQADRDAMAELAALPCQQCDPGQPRQAAKVHCSACNTDYCKQHDDGSHAVALLASHRRISIAAHAAQLGAAALIKKDAAFAAAAAASKLAAKAEESKADKAMRDAQKQKEQLPKDLNSMENVVKLTAKELRDSADRLCSDFKKHRQAVTTAAQQLVDRVADLEPLRHAAQQVQAASDYDANLGFAQLQSDSQRVHAQVEQAAVEADRSFGLDNLRDLRLFLSLSHAQRQSLILDADLAHKLAPFLSGLQLEAQPDLLYRGSRDGFARDDFVRCCANKGPTLTLVAGNGFVFGAYSHCKWPTKPSIVADPSGRSFLFSLVNASGKAARFSLRDKDRAIAVYSQTICFGADKYVNGKTVGYPIVILMRKGAADQKDANTANDTKLHDTPYQLDDATVKCNDDFLAGQHLFAAAEIEVFQM